MKLNKIIAACSVIMTIFLLSGCSDNTDNRNEVTTFLVIENTATQTKTESEDAAEPITTPAETEYSGYIPDNDTNVYDDDCAATVEKFEISAENQYMIAPIQYEIDNESGTINLDVKYENYADIYTLEHCRLDIEVNGGTYSFDDADLNDDGSVNLANTVRLLVTDEAGKIRRYVVTTNRTVYDLPIINVYLENMANASSISRNEYISMCMYIDNSGSAEYPGTEFLNGKIRGRGNSTWEWRKKPYRIKLDEKSEVLGLGENKDWVLLSNYSDKSLMRNTIAGEIGKSLDGLDWTPSQYPVDLFINGIYQGVYSIGENKEISKTRVNIEKHSSEPDTGYLVEIGGADTSTMTKGVDYFSVNSKAASFVTISDPEEYTAEQFKFIEDYLNKADAAIIAGEGYEEYIDVDSFCDWIIVQELSYNRDGCFRRSCFMNKDKGGKLKMGPIWDFDIAFGNCNKDNQNYNDWAVIGSNDESAYVKVNWCNYLMEDEEFRTALRTRWFEVRDEVVSNAMLAIDKYSKSIYQSQLENYKIWEGCGERCGYQSWTNAQADTYELQIEYLKNFINNRAKWIDENI